MEVGIEGLNSDDASILKKIKHNEDVLNPTSEAGSSVSLSSGIINSDTSCHDDENDDDMIDEEDDTFDYDDDGGYMFDNIEEDEDEADYLSMQAQFDNVDLPPGVEASFSWLKDPVSSSNSNPSVPQIDSMESNMCEANKGVASSSSAVVSAENKEEVAEKELKSKYETFKLFDIIDDFSDHQASFSWLKDPVSSSNSNPSAPQIDSMESNICEGDKDVASSSSAVVSAENKEEVAEKELKSKYENFKLFDIVDDFSDHHFNGAGFHGQQPPRNWTKKIQGEWKILEKDLPDTIFVRAYESRMDLLRAVIIGPAGTPYHDGLFVFDVHFPPNYPDIPPMVYYYSGGLRLNPNLYDCGKVCLSLLNTWTGKGNEKWMPKKSTMLQVLVSIQALILNANPFFNEPGYDDMYPGDVGEKKSRAYNEDVFILSLKTMIYTLRRPPKHFEELVGGHFRTRAQAILSACRSYMEGVPVGFLTNDGNNSVEKTGSKPFKAAVAKMVNGLVSNFTRYGATDCDMYRV